MYHFFNEYQAGLLIILNDPNQCGRFKGQTLKGKCYLVRLLDFLDRVEYEEAAWEQASSLLKGFLRLGLPRIEPSEMTPLWMQNLMNSCSAPHD